MIFWFFEKSAILLQQVLCRYEYIKEIGLEFDIAEGKYHSFSIVFLPAGRLECAVEPTTGSRLQNGATVQLD